MTNCEFCVIFTIYYIIEMLVLLLFRVDTEKNVAYKLQEGEHIIGRGSLLECTSKKVSRKHGIIRVTKNEVLLMSTHNNPCFYQSINTKHISVVKNGSTVIISNGDKIAMLPDEYWYRVQIEEQIETVNNFEDILQSEAFLIMNELRHTDLADKTIENKTSINCSGSSKRENSGSAEGEISSKKSKNIEDCLIEPEVSTNKINENCIIKQVSTNKINEEISENIEQSRSPSPDLLEDFMNPAYPESNLEMQPIVENNNINIQPIFYNNNVNLQLHDNVSVQPLSEPLYNNNYRCPDHKVEKKLNVSSNDPILEHNLLNRHIDPDDVNLNPIQENIIITQESDKCPEPDVEHIPAISNNPKNMCLISNLGIPPVIKKIPDCLEPNSGEQTKSDKNLDLDQENHTDKQNNNESLKPSLEQPVIVHNDAKSEVNLIIQPVIENSVVQLESDVENQVTLEINDGCLLNNEALETVNEVLQENQLTDTYIKNELIDDNKYESNDACEVKIEPKEEEETNTDDNLNTGAPSTSGTSTTFRDRCWYGRNCYRKNLNHKTQFRHPGDADYDSDPNDTRPICGYGSNCYRKNITHRKQYRHPGQGNGNSKPNLRKRRKTTKNDTKLRSDSEDSYDYSDPFLNDNSSDEYQVSDTSESDDDVDEDGDKEEVKRLMKEARKFMKNGKKD